MDRYESLRKKLKNRETVTMGNLMALTSPIMLRAFNGADCVLIDKEHGVYGTEELIPLTLQCRALGLPSIIRVEDKMYHLIAKAIDLGADGIMVPRTETVEQVKCAVEAMHFAPVGRTGVGGWGLFREGTMDYEAFEKSRFLFIQIESPEGLVNMDAMMEAYGEYIDAFVIGPNDYSVMMGVPFLLDHPVMMAEYEKFYEKCRKYGKSCGIFDPDMAHAKRDKAMGANIFWLSDDLSCLKAGFDALSEAVRQM